MPDSCIYCSSLTSIKCLNCDLHFCNSRGSSNVSHIIYHLTKSKHKDISISEVDVKCRLCDVSNAFKLGFDGDKVDLENFEYDENKNFSVGEIENLMQKISNFQVENTNTKNDGTRNNNLNEIVRKSNDISKNNILNSEDQILSNQFQENLKNDKENFSETKEYLNNLNEKINTNILKHIECRDCVQKTSFVPIISERCLLLNIVDSPNISNINLKKTEESYNLKSTKLTYTHEEYVNINIALLTLECEQEKINKEELKQENVVVRFEKRNEKRMKDVNGETINETNFYVCFQLKDADNKTKAGDEITLTSENATISAFIMQGVSASEEIRARVYKVKGIINERDLYTIEYIWKSAGMDRMISGLTNMQKMNKTIFDYILGNFETEDSLEKNYKKIIASINTIIEDPPNLPALNPSQKKAVNAALVNQLTLIQGPPGTGKTITSAAIIYNLVKKKKR
ncbi:ATP-dependent RNA helicase [Gurleya vavrai]